MTLWTLQEVQDATQGTFHGAMQNPVNGVSIDTRSLQPGDLFVALEGVRDGHDFVAQAFEKGASLALVRADKAQQLAQCGPLLGVQNVLEALRRIGMAARNRTHARILAVTGSVGKTGTKEALKAVLEAQDLTHASAASYNNHFGVPLTLARMPMETRFAVFEIGMNHAFEILPLTHLVRPHVALITTVEPVHIEHFRAVEGIADAKGEIFAGLLPGGTAVLNRDNPHFERLKAHALASQAGRILSFGEDRESHVRLITVQLEADGSVVEASLLGRKLSYRLGAPGRHLVQNSLGLLASIWALGADVEQAAHDLEKVGAPQGRGERIVLHLTQGKALLIDESYNANPASMRAAIENLARIPARRRIAVLGDMLELGETGPLRHAELAEVLQNHKIDLVFASGPLMQQCWEALPASLRGGYKHSAAELEPLVREAILPDDAIMVKGSNGSRIALVAKAMKERYGIALV